MKSRIRGKSTTSVGGCASVDHCRSEVEVDETCVPCIAIRFRRSGLMFASCAAAAVDENRCSGESVLEVTAPAVVREEGEARADNESLSDKF